jgi:putative redox protein
MGGRSPSPHHRRSFVIETDEPAPLGGTDAAVDPMELLLASLGNVPHDRLGHPGRRRGVDFQDPSIEVEGDYDLRGYLALDEGVRPGFGTIRYTVQVESDAAAETLEDIRQAAERTSPMFDNDLNGARVGARIERAA